MGLYLQMQMKMEMNQEELFFGRIPFGFFEEQLLEYFSQFGDITRLRLSRNKKTGKSKHYAFIEFKEEEVADIVVDAMDGYLLFGHILQVKRIEPDKVHPKIWKGRYSNPNRGLHIKPKLRKKIEKTNRVIILLYTFIFNKYLISINI